MLGLTNLWKISDEKLESTVSALFKAKLKVSISPAEDAIDLERAGPSWSESPDTKS